LSYRPHRNVGPYHFWQILPVTVAKSYFWYDPTRVKNALLWL